MSVQKSALFISVLLSAAALSSSARALTAEDVLDRMSKDEGNGYLAGSVEMAAFLANVQGDRERSQCIMGWYFEDGGVRQVIETMQSFKDRQAQPILYALMRRACGE